MEIKSFRLVNVGRFSDLEVALAPTERHASKVTVLVGNNGAGKTTLLKSVATSLSWLVARVRTPKGAGSRIDEGMVQNGTATSSITIRIEDVLISDDEINPLETEWGITATRKGRNATSSTVLSELNRLADGYRSKLTEKSDTSLPLLAFYPVERSVIEIPLKVHARHTFDQLDGYDNALGRGVDFRRFFEWFREREDSENETGISIELLNELSQKILIDTELWKVDRKSVV